MKENKAIKRDKSERLDHFIKHPKRAIWTIALPMMAGFMIHALYMIVDAAFIGRLGPEALAASTFIGAFFFIVISFTNGLATGITAMIAQAVGRRDTKNIDHIASNSLSLAFLIGVFFAVIGLIFGPDLISLLGAEGKSADLAWDYFIPICFAIPMFFLSTVFRAVMTGEGDAKIPMIILGVSTIINAALDPLFIFVFDMGIKGAAYATFTASMVSLSSFIYITLISKRLTARFRLSLLGLVKKIVIGIIKLGIPATLVHFVMALGMMLINRVLAEFGQLAVAGFGAGSKVDMIVALPVLGLTSAAMTVVGMFAGANRSDLIRLVTVYTYKWALFTALILGGIAFLLSEHIVRIFTDDPFVISIGIDYIQYIVFAFPFMSFGMTTGRILQGLGYGWPTLIISSVRVLLVGVLVSYIAVYMFSAPIEIVWISFILGGFSSNILSFYWIRKYLWLNDPCKMALKA